MFVPALSVLKPATNRHRAEASRITATEMKYTRKTAGNSWGEHETNTEIAKEINITPVLHKIREYSRNSLQHTNRMTANKLPRVLKKLQTDRQKEPGENCRLAR